MPSEPQIIERIIEKEVPVTVEVIKVIERIVEIPIEVQVTEEVYARSRKASEEKRRAEAEGLAAQEVREVKENKSSKDEIQVGEGKTENTGEGKVDSTIQHEKKVA